MGRATDRALVLLIEDDADTVMVISLGLRSHGFDVVPVANGELALELLQIFTPDVILLDLIMPVLDGFAFLERYDGPVPAVVLSAWSDLTDLPREPYAVLLKPSSLREVAGLLWAAARSWRY